MIEITVTTTPLDLGAALGIPTEHYTWFPYRAQNRGPETVYRWTGDSTAPTPGGVRPFRHPVGDTFPLRLSTADLGVTWVWVAKGEAALVLEEGDYGA